MRAYYNDIDRFCCDWLSNLMDAGCITPGVIDDRSIADISPDDLAGYERVHFFAGIGGWDYALDLAGWQGPAWTGSCPCQRLSSAHRGRPTADDLWPEWRRLIASERPRALFGEQVASREWFDRLCDDVEALDYEIGAAVLPALCVGPDHLRHRVFFACHTDDQGQPSVPLDGKAPRLPGANGNARRVGPSHGISGGMARVFSAFGNAIVPQVAAEFIGAYMETR